MFDRVVHTPLRTLSIFKVKNKEMMSMSMRLSMNNVDEIVLFLYLSRNFLSRNPSDSLLLFRATVCVQRLVIFTRIMSIVSFYTPWKLQETWGFLMHLGGIEKDQWHETSLVDWARSIWAPTIKARVRSRNNWKHCFMLFITYLGLGAFIFNVFSSEAFAIKPLQFQAATWILFKCLK